MIDPDPDSDPDPDLDETLKPKRWVLDKGAYSLAWP
jgi:hypothetical protein